MGWLTAICKEVQISYSPFNLFIRGTISIIFKMITVRSMYFNVLHINSFHFTFAVFCKKRALKVMLQSIYMIFRKIGNTFEPVFERFSLVFQKN